MLGIYFSGTGNTKYCIEKFMSMYNDKVSIIPLEKTDLALEEIEKHQDIIFAYPIYYSNLPTIVRDFIELNKIRWKQKRIFIICTMGLFSGDGSGLSARLFKKYGATIIGGLHVKMPDCICDVKTLKRSDSQNRQIVKKANTQIELAAKRLKKSVPTKEGLNLCYHLAGLFGQRLWFFNKTRLYSDKLQINPNTCIGCGNCTLVCPMNNLSLVHGKIVTDGQCTMCYRCINQCPQKSITLIGTKVISQYTVNDFLE